MFQLPFSAAGFKQKGKNHPETKGFLFTTRKHSMSCIGKGRVCPLKRAGKIRQENQGWIPLHPVFLLALHPCLHPPGRRVCLCPCCIPLQPATSPTAPCIMSSCEEEPGYSGTTSSSLPALLFNPSSNSTAKEKRWKKEFSRRGKGIARGCPTPGSLEQHPFSWGRF